MWKIKKIFTGMITQCYLNQASDITTQITTSDYVYYSINNASLSQKKTVAF